MFSYLQKLAGKRLPCMFFPTGRVLSFRRGSHSLTSGFFFFTRKAPRGCQNRLGNNITVITRIALKIPLHNGNGSKKEPMRKKVF